MTDVAGDGGGTLTGPPGPLPAAGPLRPGDPRRIGGYEVLGRLGEGGMGTVFLARAAGGALVAVKVVRSEFARDPQFRARFRAEANAARRVAPFCTAQVLDVGVDGGIDGGIDGGVDGGAAYLVTEFIDGPTLSAVVAADGPLRGSMLDTLAIGVVAALHGIHSAGVVHCDLKPGNVLLSRVGPKVIDFGIARALDGLDTVVAPDQVIGTPAYMAPEQFAGVCTAATDVFTWGSVVTYAGTGRSPFGTGAPYELMHRVTSGEPDLTGLKQPLRGLVARALSKRPEDRPSARTLLLAQADGDDPVEATTRVLVAGWTPPPTPDPAPTPTRVDAAPPTRVAAPGPRSRRGVRALAAATVAALLLVAVLLWWPDPGGDGNGSQPRPSASAIPGTVAPTSGEPDIEGPVVDEPDIEGPDRDGPAGDGPERIVLGARVPTTGVGTVGVGEVHRYVITIPAAGPVYLNGDVDACAHLVPWRLSGPAGPVADGRLGCEQYGPMRLAAGEYELAIGGEGVEGDYAFTVVRR
jgi:serine/threonine protein kinase